MGTEHRVHLGHREYAGAVRSVSSLGVYVSHRQQAVADQVNGRTALLKRNVAKQRLVLTLFRFHLDEQNLAVDCPEALDRKADTVIPR